MQHDFNPSIIKNVILILNTIVLTVCTEDDGFDVTSVIAVKWLIQLVI